jgi:hypothetical protein
MMKKTKNWEDRFIFGEAGFWYVIVGDVQSGYFHYLKNARAFVKKLVI